MSSLRSLLIVGATGKQGGALISSLVERPRQDFKIYALTRSKTSSKSQQLAKHDNVTVIEGDLNNLDSVFQQITKPIYGLFAVPILDKGPEKEEHQMKALVDASVEAGVEHIVFASLDRGGDGVSDDEPTPVPHFASKFRTEQYIKAKATASNEQMTYTFLRPVAFMENFNPGFFGKAHQTMWSMNGQYNRLQMISTKDIGKVGAEAFLHRSEPRYKNKGISLAGDALTPAEVANIFKEETGQAVPTTFWLAAAAIRYGITDLRHMYNWFKEVGFGVDITAVRKEYPFLQDFRTWLREESGFKK